MNRSKEHREELEEVFHELRTINVWDIDFFCAEQPGLIEFIACENRRRRVFQIYQALFAHLNQAGNSGRHDIPQAATDGEDP